jgi:general secretion pathway protein N
LKLRWPFFLPVAVLVAAAVVLFIAPAQWMAAAIASASGGRVELAEASGTFWSGQGTVVVGSERRGASASTSASASANGVALPQPFTWRLSPVALLTGTLDATLTHPSALAQPLRLRIDLAGHVDAGPAHLQLPATLLTGLGAPWNTLRPGGVLLFTWDHLSLDPAAGRMAGNLNAEWQQASSSLTPVSPFGHYRLQTNGVFPGTQLSLSTVAGPLEMVGNGTIDAGGKLRFQGTARPMAGVDPVVSAQLAGLITLLGRRSGESATMIIGN